MNTCVNIRVVSQIDTDILKEFLYQAIFVPIGEKKPEKSIVDLPELSMYYSGFGEYPGDTCVVAETDSHIIGVAWTRCMHDYGYVSEDTPSLAIAILEPYRGQGIGTRLLMQLFRELQARGYNRVSLSVQKENRAFCLYKKCGFQVVREQNGEVIMIKQLHY